MDDYQTYWVEAGLFEQRLSVLEYEELLLLFSPLSDERLVLDKEFAFVNPEVRILVVINEI